jgi:hypothetical protein
MSSVAEPVTNLNPVSMPLTLSPQAVAKVHEIMATQDPLPAGLRIGVVGGGCSGFQYSMSFENQAGMMDKVFKFDDLKAAWSITSKPWKRPGLNLITPRSRAPAAAVPLSTFKTSPPRSVKKVSPQGEAFFAFDCNIPASLPSSL